jgi:hypothetical protein
MRITRRQLRKIIRETNALSRVLYVERGEGPFMYLKDDTGNDYAMGEIIAELLDAGLGSEIFAVRPDSTSAMLARLQAKREEGVQGGIERWDQDVFETYYNIDNEMAVEVWADMKGLEIEIVQVDEYGNTLAGRNIRESLLKEEMLKIMDNPYEDLSTFNRIANYALTNDIAGAMADPEVNTDELYWELDEMRGWVGRVGDDSDNFFGDDAVVPEGWDADAVYEFMGDLESAWHQDQERKDNAAIAADPDKDWLKFMGDAWTSSITPNDLETLGWKEYKRYIRLSPPESISHGVGEVHITNDDIKYDGPGTREEFVEFLTKRAGRTLKKRKSTPPMMPYYD